LSLSAQLAALRECGQHALNRLVAAALAAFTPVWGSLAPREQVRLIQLLIERVDFDGVQGRVAITFHRSGIRALADDLAAAQKEKNA
jgi:site-specific DNA recombinase